MNTLDLILAGAPTSGVYRVATRSSAQEIMHQAARRSWHGGCLSGRSIVDKASFLRASARALAFPAYFGHNWDAFEECLTDFAWLHCAGSLLLYDEPVHFANNSPREWQTALAILQASADPWRQQQKPFYVLLRKTYGAAPEISLVVTR